MNSEPVRIRPYQPDDLDDLYRVWLQTADNGRDGTSLFRDPKLPGHVYAGRDRATADRDGNLTSSRAGFNGTAPARRAQHQLAAGFYRHVGFTELPAGDLHIFAMNLAGHADLPE